MEEHDALVARAAHDLRQPLHALIATSEEMWEQITDSVSSIEESLAKGAHEKAAAMGKEALHKIKEDLLTMKVTHSSMQNLVEQFLAMSEAKGGKVVEEPCKLEQTCLEVRRDWVEWGGVSNRVRTRAGR